MTSLIARVEAPPYCDKCHLPTPLCSFIAKVAYRWAKRRPECRAESFNYARKRLEAKFAHFIQGTQNGR